MEHYFYLKESLTNYSYSDVGIWQTVAQKGMKWACHLKEKKLAVFVANDKIRIFKHQLQFYTMVINSNGTLGPWIFADWHIYL